MRGRVKGVQVCKNLCSI